MIWSKGGGQARKEVGPSQGIQAKTRVLFFDQVSLHAGSWRRRTEGQDVSSPRKKDQIRVQQGPSGWRGGMCGGTGPGASVSTSQRSGTLWSLYAKNARAREGAWCPWITPPSPPRAGSRAGEAGVDSFCSRDLGASSKREWLLPSALRHQPHCKHICKGSPQTTPAPIGSGGGSPVRHCTVASGNTPKCVNSSRGSWGQTKDPSILIWPKPDLSLLRSPTPTSPQMFSNCSHHRFLCRTQRAGSGVKGQGMRSRTFLRR